MFHKKCKQAKVGIDWFPSCFFAPVFSSFIHDANCLNRSYQVVRLLKLKLFQRGFGTSPRIRRPNYIWTHQVYIIHSKQSTAADYAHVNYKRVPWIRRNYTQISPHCAAERRIRPRVKAGEASTPRLQTADLRTLCPHLVQKCVGWQTSARVNPFITSTARGKRGGTRVVRRKKKTLGWILLPC